MGAKMLELNKVAKQQPEDYNSGWAHGFYDAKSDDGAYYGNRARAIHPFALTDAIEAERLYDEGYRKGKLMRLRGDL